MVTVNDNSKPVIWRVIKEDLVFVFDEVSSNQTTSLCCSPIRDLVDFDDYVDAGRVQQELRG